MTPHEDMVYWLHADATWITLSYPREAERMHKAANCLASLGDKLTEAVAFWESNRARAAELEALIPDIIAVAQHVRSHGDRPYEESDRLLDYFGAEA